LHFSRSIKKESARPNQRSKITGLDAWFATHGGRIVYFAFDVLWLDGKDLRELPLLERKKLLRSTFRASPMGGLR
jgi:hypothetical protein